MSQWNFKLRPLSEAHTSLAFCLEGFDWDSEAAESEFLTAIELSPGYATAHHWYAWHLALIGRKDDSLSEMRKAENLDPLSLIINADLAELLLIEGSPSEAINQSRKTIEMDSSFALAPNQLGQAYLKERMFPEAISESQKAVQLSGGSRRAWPTWPGRLQNPERDLKQMHCSMS